MHSKVCYHQLSLSNVSRLYTRLCSTSAPGTAFILRRGKQVSALNSVASFVLCFVDVFQGDPGKLLRGCYLWKIKRLTTSIRSSTKVNNMMVHDDTTTQSHAEGCVLTECPNKAWAISCPRIMVSWWTSATVSSIPVNMNTCPFYKKKKKKMQSKIWAMWCLKIFLHVYRTLGGNCKPDSTFYIFVTYIRFSFYSSKAMSM